MPSRQREPGQTEIRELGYTQWSSGGSHLWGTFTECVGGPVVHRSHSNQLSTTEELVRLNFIEPVVIEKKDLSEGCLSD